MLINTILYVRVTIYGLTWLIQCAQVCVCGRWKKNKKQKHSRIFKMEMFLTHSRSDQSLRWQPAWWVTRPWNVCCSDVFQKNNTFSRGKENPQVPSRKKKKEKEKFTSSDLLLSFSCQDSCAPVMLVFSWKVTIFGTVRSDQERSSYYKRVMSLNY